MSYTPPAWKLRPNQGAIKRDNNSSLREPRHFKLNNSRNRFQRPADNSDNDFTLKYLQDLSKKNSEELIEKLLDKHSELLERFQDDLAGDFYVVVVQLLSKVCSSTFHKVKREILQFYLTEKFTKKITNYISTLPLHDKSEKTKNDLFWSDPDSFWLNLTQISEQAFNEIPNFAHKVLTGVVKATQMAISELEEKHGLTTSEEIKLSVDNIRKRIDLIAEEKKKKLELTEAEKKYKEPPNDFRQISIYPTPEELLSNHMSFLRENVVVGPYRDVNHYLDVQFRLLREDFVSPLRKSIQGYLSNLKNGTNERLDSVTIYNKVRFLCSQVVNEDRCYRIKFDPYQHVTEDDSKNFMCGSLLCFTRDSSFKTLLFGKVAAHNKNELKLSKGEVIVAFTDPVDIIYNSDYIMLESKVFFEPYFHVLTQLRQMMSYYFPLERYIIKVDSDVQPVEYSKEIIAYSKCFERSLNDSQKEAFKAALSREIAIIQGPPGTGKTHLAKLIVQALLRGEHLWYDESPILVICFTNHALDQFLEGINCFTDKIVRVGGQSKSEVLEEFNLNNIKRYEFALKKRKDKDFEDPVRKARQKYRVISDEINSFSRILNYINSFKGIIALGNYYRNIEVLNRDNILNWLGGSDLINKVPEDQDNEEDDVPNLPNSIFIEKFNKYGNADCYVFDTDFNRCEIGALEEEKHKICNKLEVKFSKEEYDKLQEVNAKLSHRRKFDALFYEKLRTLSKSDSSELIGDITEEEACVSLDDRWKFYLYHLNNYKNYIIVSIDDLNRGFRRRYRIYAGLKEIEDTRILKKALVVGMTTTCAARMKPVLEAIKSPIVVVEEAAEVLEAHITSALTEHCKHLILIGDHQQLKPSTADYSIEKRFKLGTSLFERMVLNKIQCFTLNIQHRMKPEISALIAPTIYPDLRNHEFVNERAAIRGVDHSLFFIDHKIHEEITKTGTSKSNMHEVYFLISLARHFLLNGYKPDDITILVTYLGQMYKMQKEKNKYGGPLKDVRVAVLDNYQGEQSNIILLSLVRSNAEGKIGFLAIENRVCVALSRARDGLFIIGNMAQLSQASEIWRKIHTTLKGENNIGPALELHCANHPEKRTFVKEFKDFLKVPEGGCDQICGFDLTCGHKCVQFCHIFDPEHDKYVCKKSCEKLLCKENELHVCRKLCYKKCGKCTYPVEKKLKCGHTVSIECHEDPSVFQCPVLLPTTLSCGHTVEKPCHINTSTFSCPFPCSEIFSCGHSCSLKCHVDNDPKHLEYKCEEPCKLYAKDCKSKDGEKHLCRSFCYQTCELCCVPVKKQRTICSHFYTVECYVDIDALKCKKPCKKFLICGHKCRMLCNQPCKRCEEQVIKLLPCNHRVKLKCWQEPEKKLCKKNCSLLLPCGHKCTEKCNEACTSACKVIVDFELTLPCNHQSTKLPCYLTHSSFAKEIDEDWLQEINNCREPCREILKCGHNCSGSCSECFQGRMHRRCVKNVKNNDESVVQKDVEDTSLLNFKYKELQKLYKGKNIGNFSLSALWDRIGENLVNTKHLLFLKESESLKMRTAISFKLKVLQDFAGVFEFIHKNQFSDNSIKKKSQFLFKMLETGDFSFITEQEIHEIRNEFNRLANIVQSLHESEEKTTLALEIKKLVDKFQKFSVNENNQLVIITLTAEE